MKQHQQQGAKTCQDDGVTLRTYGKMIHCVGKTEKAQGLFINSSPMCEKLQYINDVMASRLQM